MQISNAEKIDSIIDTNVDYSLTEHKYETILKRNNKIQDMESYIEKFESVFHKSAQYI